MGNRVITNRSEVPEHLTWNLSDMFENDDKWNEAYDELKNMPAMISEYKGKLGKSGKMLLDFFSLEDTIDVNLGKLIGYASCKSDEHLCRNKQCRFLCRARDHGNSRRKSE